MDVFEDQFAYCSIEVLISILHQDTPLQNFNLWMEKNVNMITTIISWQVFNSLLY